MPQWIHRLALPAPFRLGARFASLLGDPEQGHWRLAPSDPSPIVERRYRRETLVLETTLTTAEGTVRVVDFMPPRSGTNSEHTDLVRLVEGMEGRVAMRMHLTLRFDYGSVVPWVTRNGDRLHAVAGPDAVVLDTPVVTHGENQSTVADFTVGNGENLSRVAW